MLRLRSAGRRVIFLRNDGNYGDGLIRHAAELFLHDVGIEPLVMDTSTRWKKLAALAMGAADPYGRRTLFVYNGGGAWAEHCSVGLRAVARQLKVCADVVVLPSTIEMMPLVRRPTIYRRDQSESRALMPDAPFCHDMAFYLGLLPQQRWFQPTSESPGNATQGPTNTGQTRRPKGIFFRRDNESRIATASSLPGNCDISQWGNHLSDIQVFLREIDRCDEVVTDRLHVAIAGVLLGRKVFLAPGKTFKIRAIFEASIAPFFDNCELVSDAEALSRATG